MARTTTARQAQLVLDLPSERRSGYGSTEVQALVGITYRQLDHWARTDLVPPSVQGAHGSGSQRIFSFEDIVRLRVIKRLLDTGVGLERIRAALEELTRQGRSLADVTLASDGRTVYAMDDDRQLLDLLKKGQAVFAIALEPLVEELRGEVTALPLVQATGTDASATAITDARAV